MTKYHEAAIKLLLRNVDDIHEIIKCAKGGEGFEIQKEELDDQPKHKQTPNPS